MWSGCRCRVMSAVEWLEVSGNVFVFKWLEASGSVGGVVGGAR